MHQAKHGGLTVIFLFKDYIKISLKAQAFFLFQKSLRNLNHRQYGSTYLVHVENIRKFLIENWDQDKIWTEIYRPFNDSTYIAIERSFLVLERFLKSF